MKIVHIGTGVVPVLPFGSRGPEKTIYYSTKHLARLGYDVDIIDMKQGAHDRGETEARFHEISLPSIFNSSLFSYLKIMIFSLISTFMLSRLIKNGRVDIVHAHSQFPAAAILIARWIFHWHIPLIYTAHNPYLVMPCGMTDKLKHTILECMVMRCVDCVVSQTLSVGEELQRKYGIDPAQVLQVSAGIDIEAISAFPGKSTRRTGNPLILYVAIINLRKNQMSLVQSIPQVLEKFPDAEFIFPGAVDDPAYFEKIKQFIDEHSLSENVVFTGDLSTQELYRVYRDATMFVFPTRYETQGVVLLEAMAFGLPVIASDIGPIRDIVEMEHHSALLIDPENTKNIGASIIRVLEDEALRTEMSSKGMKLTHNTFSWDHAARRMASAYHKFVRVEQLNTSEVTNNG